MSSISDELMKMFFEAMAFLENHRIFECEGLDYFHESLCFSVVKVNPDTMAIDDDSTLNTKVRIWLECGPVYTIEEINNNAADSPHGMEIGDSKHDYDLDCGGDTFEEAIIELAKLVKAKYGE